MPSVLIKSGTLDRDTQQGRMLIGGLYLCCLVAKSCSTLCDLMDCSLPGFSVHGLFQARILEWVAFPFSRGSSWPRDQTHVSHISCIGRSLSFHHQGNPSVAAEQLRECVYPFKGKKGPCPKVLLLLLLTVCFSLVLHPLHSLVTNCLHLLIGIQRRSWRLNEGYFW